MHILPDNDSELKLYLPRGIFLAIPYREKSVHCKCTIVKLLLSVSSPGNNNSSVSMHQAQPGATAGCTFYLKSSKKTHVKGKDYVHGKSVREIEISTSLKGVLQTSLLV